MIYSIFYNARSYRFLLRVLLLLLLLLLLLQAQEGSPTRGGLGVFHTRRCRRKLRRQMQGLRCSRARAGGATSQHARGCAKLREKGYYVSGSAFVPAPLKLEFRVQPQENSESAQLVFPAPVVKLKQPLLAAVQSIDACSYANSISAFQHCSYGFSISARKCSHGFSISAEWCSYALSKSAKA